ncbi:MAG: DUF4282 domain-containing protein [Polyangia bacterium]
MDITELLTFKKMITPAIIQALFWIGAGIAVIAGLIGIGSGLSSSYGGGGQVLAGLLILLLGPVCARIYCELLIVLFRMYETLGQIRDGLAQMRGQGAPTAGADSGQ